MKKVKIESFISQNREAFDDESPSPAVWAAIEKNLPHPKAHTNIRWISFARMAAIFVLGAFSWGIINYMISHSDNNNTRSLKTMALDTSRSGITRKPLQAAVIKTDNTDQKTVAQQYTPAKKDQTQQYAVPNEMMEIQTYYLAQINVKLKEILTYASTHPDIQQQIMSELADVDRIYDNLKSDLNDNVDNQEVMEAITMNYRARIDMLDVTLQQLKEKE